METPRTAVITITCRRCGRVLRQTTRSAGSDEIETQQACSPAFASVLRGCPDHPAKPPTNGLQYTSATCPLMWTVRLHEGRLSAAAAPPRH